MARTFTVLHHNINISYKKQLFALLIKEIKNNCMPLYNLKNKRRCREKNIKVYKDFRSICSWLFSFGIHCERRFVQTGFLSNCCVDFFEILNTTRFKQMSGRDDAWIFNFVQWTEIFLHSQMILWVVVFRTLRLYNIFDSSTPLKYDSVQI